MNHRCPQTDPDKTKGCYIPFRAPSLYRHLEGNEANILLAKKPKLELSTLEFQEALKKPLDLLWSNVKGARGKKAEGIDFDA